MNVLEPSDRRSFLRRSTAALTATAACGTAVTEGSAMDAGKADPSVYREAARDIPVLGEYDVVVCGGGPAGCAAAVAAARLGAKTLLLEKTFSCGGKAAGGLVAVVLSTNGMDFQGIWHQWARLLRTRGGMATLIRAPSPFYPGLQWFRSSFDPEMAKWVWETLLDEAGAEMLFDAPACSVIRDATSVRGVLCQTIAGRQAVLARRVIDATGHGIICHEAGADWHRGVEGKPWAQAVHLNYHIGWATAMPGFTPDATTAGAGGTVGNKPLRRAWAGPLKQVDPLDPRDVTRAIRTLRTQVWQKTQRLPAEQYLATTASELGDRTLRIIRGIDCVTNDDAWHYRKQADGIARSSWELDVHPADDSPVPQRHFHSRSAAYAERNARTAAGEYFDIPYGALIPNGVDNLLAAGRIVSSELAAQGSLRIQQTCMATGQAAGTAAALSVIHNVAPRNLDVPSLLDQLAKDRAVEPAFESLAELPHPVRVGYHQTKSDSYCFGDPNRLIVSISSIRP